MAPATTKTPLLPLTAVLLAAALAAAAPGLVRENSSMEAGEATSARVELRMSSGRMNVSGGGDKLMEAVFSLPAGVKAPAPSYRIEDGMGELKVRQPRSWLSPAGMEKSGWEVKLGRELPIALLIHNTSGETDADLGGVNLIGLEIESSSGRTALSLPGSFPELCQVEAKLGAGQAEIKLPGAFPSLKSFDLAMNTGPLNSSFSGTYSSPMDVELKSSSGRISLAMAGEFNAPAALDVKTTSGGITADLTGTWKNDLNAVFSTSSGDVIIKLPSGVGVKVEAKAGPGGFDSGGLEQSGGAYVNRAFGASAVTLVVKVKSSSGKIRLETDQ